MIYMHNLIILGGIGAIGLIALSGKSGDGDVDNFSSEFLDQPKQWIPGLETTSNVYNIVFESPSKSSPFAEVFAIDTKKAI